MRFPHSEHSVRTMSTAAHLGFSQPLGPAAGHAVPLSHGLRLCAVVALSCWAPVTACPSLLSLVFQVIFCSSAFCAHGKQPTFNRVTPVKSGLFHSGAGLGNSSSTHISASLVPCHVERLPNRKKFHSSLFCISSI